LPDLDRAVRFSPRVARYYYHRSQVLRQLGDAVRAQADEARAVELDPRYASVVEN
jgi:Flp pilus assembly protein TadD